jgi:hypothetical protein
LIERPAVDGAARDIVEIVVEDVGVGRAVERYGCFAAVEDAVPTRN